MGRTLLLGLLLAACNKNPATPPPAKQEPPPPQETPPRDKTPPESKTPPVDRTETLDLSSYDRKCKTDEACVVVGFHPCGECGCADTPLARHEQQRFHDDLESLDCAHAGPPDDCGDCEDAIPYCDTGLCKARH